MEGFEPGDVALREPRAFRRSRVHDRRARDRDCGGVGPDHDAIARGRRRGRLEAKLRPARFTRRKRVALEEDGAAQDLARAEVAAKAGARPQGLGGGREELEPDIEERGRAEAAGRRQPVAARDALARRPVDRERHPLPRLRLLDGGVVDLDLADADGLPGGKKLEGVPRAHRPAPEGAGHHGPDALDREHAVDRKARRPRRGPPGRLPDDGLQGLDQLLHPGPGGG